MVEHRWISIAAALLAAATLPAGATSYVPMTDAALADTSPIIVVGEVLAVAPAAENPLAFTDYRVEISRLLKGQIFPRRVTVRVPGSPRAAEGVGVKVWGTPRFAVGERALLFLEPRRDGTYGIMQLFLGAFHEVARSGQRLALRDLSEATAVAVPGTPGSPAAEPLRDFDRFSSWLEDRGRFLLRQPDYVVSKASVGGGLESIAGRFTLFESNGINFRWFQFDNGGSVTWRADQSGQAGVPGGGFTQVQGALQAWTDDPGSDIRMVYGGTTAATGGLVQADGVNAVLWDDPNGEIPGTFSCSSGGILAMGGITTTSGSGTFNGKTYFRIGEGDVVTQDGAGCFFAADSGKDGEEVLGHEVGHALGLGHSCGDSFSPSCTDPVLNDALMRAVAHGLGRGARLGSDDRAAVELLYPDTGSAALDFFTLNPCRVLDTRNPNGPLGGPALSSGVVRVVTATGSCGIPTTAQAISINVTVVNPGGTGFVTLFPGNLVPTGTSTLNFAAGQVRANNAILRLATDGSGKVGILANLGGTGKTHLILDVNGYFQ